MSRQNEQQIIRTALICLPETAPAGLYSMLEVFSCVGEVWEQLTGKEATLVRFQVDVVTEKQGSQTCALGVPVTPGTTFEAASGYDLVLLPDVLVNEELDPVSQWPAAARWIRSQYEAGAVVGSACTGALVLAESGLLEGEEATTHWGIVPVFKARFPKVNLRPNRVLILSGPDRRIITAGGASSWTELALYLISHYCGRAEAIRIAKVFLLGDLSEGQLPFAAVTRPQAHTDAIIDRCQLWIAEHYEVSSPVEKVTEFSGLNSRTFKRRFRAATGWSPMEYIQTLRIEESKYLLETTSMPIDQVGEEVGYEDPTSFRRLFKRTTGVTPAHYRRRFQKIGCGNRIAD